MKQIIKKEKNKNINFIFFGIILFFVCLLIYLYSLTPTIGFHDSGDMVSAAYTLGVAHPPGYPLYSLIGRIFCLLPFSNVAFRINFMSSLIASACLLFLFLTFNFLTSRTIGGIIAVLVLGLNSVYFTQAVVAEKYGLNLLFYSFIQFILFSGRKNLGLILFFFCISLTHHLSTIFLFPAIFIYLIATKKITNISNLILPDFKKIPLLFLPLTLYLYLFLRGINQPLANWGEVKNWPNFIAHITATSYAGFFSWENTFSNLLFFLKYLIKEYHLFIIFAVVGVIVCWKYKKGELFYLISLIILSLLHTIRYNIPNIEDYFLISFFSISIFIGVGFDKIRNFLFKGKLVGVIIPFILIFLLYGISQNQRRFYFVAYDYIINLISPLSDKGKEGIIYISHSDESLFPFWYTQYIENWRTYILPLNPILAQNDWYLSQLKERYPKFDTSYVLGSMEERMKRIVKNNLETHSIFSPYLGSISEEFFLLPEYLLCSTYPKEYSHNKEFIENNIKSPYFLSLRYISHFKDRRTLELIKTYKTAYGNLKLFYKGLNNKREKEKAARMEQFFLKFLRRR